MSMSHTDPSYRPMSISCPEPVPLLVHRSRCLACTSASELAAHLLALENGLAAIEHWEDRQPAHFRSQPRTLRPDRRRMPEPSLDQARRLTPTAPGISRTASEPVRNADSHE